MKNRIVISIFLCVCILINLIYKAPAVRGDELTLNALSAVLIDADTGRILYDKNADERRAMASTTKIMTCIIALENGNMDDVVTFSDYAASMPKVHMGGRTGEQYKLKDLLYALMLESYNDVAVAIAEHIGGSVEGFAMLMNEKAKQIGALNTHFVTPNGLDAQEHYSTAYDMALIGAYAIQNEDFIDITNTKSHSFSDVKGTRSITVNNKDAFLTMMDGAIGIKTGFTGKAGYCFVGAVKQGDKKLVSVVLGSGWPPNKSYKWRDTLSLMKYGVENYEYKKVFDGIDEYRQIRVVDGQNETVGTEIKGELSMLLAKHENVTFESNIKKHIFAPVKKGESAGILEVKVDGKTVGSFNICTTESVEKTDFKYYFEKVLSEFLLLMP